MLRVIANRMVPTVAAMRATSVRAFAAKHDDHHHEEQAHFVGTSLNFFGGSLSFLPPWDPRATENRVSGIFARPPLYLITTIYFTLLFVCFAVFLP